MPAFSAPPSPARRPVAQPVPAAPTALSLAVAGCAALLLAASAARAADARPQSVGAGAVWPQAQGSDRDAPPADGRTEAMKRQAAPTNQWYSSVLFKAQPDPIYAQPLSVKPLAGAVEIARPVQQVQPTERGDTEIHYLHRAPLTIKPTGFAAGAPKLARTGDWSVGIDWAAGADHLDATVAHGSPFTWLTVTQGDLALSLPAAARRIEGADPRALVLELNGQRWALFGPTGVQWQAQGERGWLARLPAGKGYLSVAALPDAEPATLALFTAHAWAFIEDTRVAWQYDPASSQVRTTFTARTAAREGSETAPLLGLYPHHWFEQPQLAPQLAPGSYDTIRGRLRLLPAAQFTTVQRYGGFVPYWPGVRSASAAAGAGAGGGVGGNTPTGTRLPADPALDKRLEDLKGLLSTDQRNARRMMLEIGNGSYWQGKGLQRITQLMAVAEQQGDPAMRDALLKLVKGRLEQWFSGQDRKTYFRQDTAIGSLLAYPEEYFSIEQMNDHHFHYGYWIRAAAEVGLRDPAWTAPAQWGGMVERLIRDIANTERGAADSPFLRNVDVYEGHSWAGGLGDGEAGNNQESSSEAVNAWAGLILWAELQGNTALRDLGVWLYTSEINAIDHYWFDLHHLSLPAGYRNSEVSMLFGAKLAHNTWWIDEPRQIKGINLLPVTTASTYLGHDPQFMKKSLAELPAQSEAWARKGRRADPPDIWQDIFAKTLALNDPAAGLAQWDRWGAVEFGDTRSHTLHFLLSLQGLGRPDFSVTADAPLHAVFRRADGQRTWLAYNAGPTPRHVRFSDGTELDVPPHALAQRP